MRTRAPQRPVALLAATALAVVAASWAAGQAHARPAPEVPRTQELALLVQGQTAMSKPSNSSAPLVWVERQRPITEGQTVLPVIGRQTSADGVRWLKVRLPGRPNNRTGWIRKARTKQAATAWHVVVDLSDRRVSVYRGGRVVRAFSVVVGARATPTPLGRAFVEETVRLRPSDVGAPYAVALSSRSYVLQEFAGGPGQIALHGVWNVGGTMGTAVSKGCIRLDTPANRWVGERIGPGVPVTVIS